MLANNGALATMVAAGARILESACGPCIGMGQAPAVEEIMAQNGFEEIQSFQDTQGIWRVVSGVINE